MFMKFNEWLNQKPLWIKYGFIFTLIAFVLPLPMLSVDYLFNFLAEFKIIGILFLILAYPFLILGAIIGIFMCGLDGTGSLCPHSNFLLKFIQYIIYLSLSFIIGSMFGWIVEKIKRRKE
jgi:hypothetical protein